MIMHQAGGARRTAIFTICSNNYMPFVHVLFASLRRHHPEAELFLCLADRKVTTPGFYDQNCSVVEGAELAIPDFKSFAFRYDIMEFNTALKPFMFLYLLEDHGFDEVIYFDPDILLFAPLTPVLSRLRNGNSFVFTPHLCTPSPRQQEPNDLSIMRAGSYNLGFLAVSNQEETVKLIGWWARRLRYQCINAQPEGIFVDQKFMDLIPGFAEHAIICRETALNVAYWNLEQRVLALGEDGGWLVDGSPLIFFHFSGFDPRRRDRLSKHDLRFREDIPVSLQLLMDDYAARLFAHGYDAFPGAAYAYGKFASGTQIHPTIRAMFRDWHAYWGSDPFEDYEAFLHQPWPQGSRVNPAYTVTNFMRFLQSIVPTLGRLNCRLPDDAVKLVLWFVNDAVSKLGLDPALVEPAAERLGRLRPAAARIPEPLLGEEITISVGAPLRARGEAVESSYHCFRTLMEAGIAVELRDISGGRTAPPTRAPVQISFLSGAEAEIQRDGAGFRILALLGSNLPAPNPADEIWAPSRFAQVAFAGRVDCPVIHMPLPIVLNADQPPIPVDLPVGRFTVFAPIGTRPGSGLADALTVIRIFRAAFKNIGEACLILAPDDGIHPPKTSDSDPDIILLETPLTDGQMQSIIAHSSVVLSPHKGLGPWRIIGQAMLLGRPVIATDYGASRDLLNAKTGFPLNYKSVSNGVEADSAEASWTLRSLAKPPLEIGLRISAARNLVEAQHGVAAVAARQKARLAQLGIRVT